MKYLECGIATFLLVLAAGCGSAPSKSVHPVQAPSGGVHTDEHHQSGARSSEPGSDHPIFVARETSPLGVGPDFQKFREYLEELIRSVETEWNKILAASSVRPRTGSKVSVRFILNSDGIITQIVEVEETAGKQGTYACLHAIQSPQPYRSWTPEMIDTLGREQTLTFQFHYR